MKYIRSTLTLIALFAIGSVDARQPSEKKQPQKQQQPKPTILDTMPTHSEILSLLEKKKPTESADFFPLKSIKDEAEYQINLIQKNEHDMRAKRFDIKKAADMQTYNDISQALKQRSPESTALSTLNNIKLAAEQQIKLVPKAVQKKPVIQPATGKLTYNEILSALRENSPSSSDFSTLSNIILEATKQRDQLK
jgi:hypothetical protein